jgi:multimeric flavodoxin WrbA
LLILFETRLIKYYNGGSSIKVLGLMGSPNIKGNTAKLVNAILDGAAENGSNKVVYNLASLEIKGCDACRRCQVSGCCFIEDDMQEIYEEIRTADVVVLGSPVYMWQMTAQTKLFVDRLTAFLRPNFSSRLDNKKLILVFSQGSSDRDAFKPYFEYTAGLLYYIGFDVLDMIIAAGTDRLEVSFRPNLLEQAKDLGKLISASNLPDPRRIRLESNLTQSL